MQISEKLYQQGYISYPRTETSKFPQGFDFNTLLREQGASPNWGDFANKLLQGSFKYPRAGNGDDHAHPPIHPTKSGDGLAGEEKRLYEFITRHFLACCSDDARGEQTTVEIEIAGERFHCEGLVVLEKNYLDVYPYENWHDKGIPLFQQGEQFIPDTLTMQEGATTPPKLLTEAELIALMDSNGIGTDATIATHIQTIQDRGYAILNDGVFAPTTLGIALIEGYDSMGFDFSRPKLRSEMEADMLRIGSGQRQKKDVIMNSVAKYRQLFIRANELAEKLDQAMGKYFSSAQPNASMDTLQPQLVICGKCQNLMSLLGTLDESHNAARRTLYCSTCKHELPAPVKGALTPNEHRCPLCQFQVQDILFLDTYCIR